MEPLRTNDCMVWRAMIADTWNRRGS